MLPTLKEGDLLIYKAFSKEDCLKEGLIVVIKNPYKKNQLMVKRISKVKNSSIEIIGDNTEFSIDSRQLGAINKTYIEGIVESVMT